MPPAKHSVDWSNLWQTGSQVWSSVPLSSDAFFNYLSSHFSNDQPLPADLPAGDLYLACACGHGIPAALTALEREYFQHIPRFVGKITTNPSVVDEVTQAVRTKLLLSESGHPKILDYSGRGSLSAFLRVTAVRTAQSMFRQRDPLGVAAPTEVVDSVIGPSLDPEMAILQGKLGNHATTAVRESLQKLTPTQRNLLRLHYFDGLSFDKMGALFAVNRATACRWVAEARRSVLTETRQLLKQRLLLQESELDVVTRLLRSQLDISFSTILRPE